ncbi:30S ribosomal protein S8 [Calditrichota bacterium]
MSMTDPIADYLTRVRNAGRAGHKTVDIPESSIKLGITRVLLKEKFIVKYIRIRDTKQGLIRVYLKYTDTGEAVIDQINRLSRPGCRIYYGAKEIPRVLNGLGTLILTTPEGVLSDRDARKLNVGGEPLCEVW